MVGSGGIAAILDLWFLVVGRETRTCNTKEHKDLGCRANTPTVRGFN